MGMFSKFFSGLEDVVRGAAGSTEDLFKGDFKGYDDRQRNVRDVGESLGEGISNWASDATDFGSSMGSDWWRQIKNNPMSLLFADAAGSKFSNKMFGTSLEPMVGDYGGPTEQNYQNAEDRGVNTGPTRSAVNDAAKPIAKAAMSYFGGPWATTIYESGNAWGNDQKYGDILKKGATNVALSYLGANMGLDGQYYDNDWANAAANVGVGAVKGGVSAEANGGKFSDGAKSGAINSAVGQGAGMAQDYYNMNYGDGLQGSLGGNMQDEYGENTATYGGNYSQQDSNISSGLSQESAYAPQTQAAGGSAFERFMSALGGGQAQGQGGQQARPQSQGSPYAGLLANAMGMYQANQQRKQLRGQAESLNNLFTPNSVYSQQMRETLNRKDAAAGRRSQYGPREAQLMAALSQMQGNLAPTQMGLNKAVGGAENQMWNNALQGGLRAFNNRDQIGNDLRGLYNMFGGGQ